MKPNEHEQKKHRTPEDLNAQHGSCDCGHEHSHEDKVTAKEEHCKLRPEHTHSETHSDAHPHTPGGSSGCGLKSDHEQSQSYSCEQPPNHDGSCGCGHEHGQGLDDSCNCEHDHKHSLDDSCGCGHNHDHSHGDSCGCGHDHGAEPDKNELPKILAGAVIFAAGLVCRKLLGESLVIPLLLFLVSFVILGGEVVVSAVKSLVKGRMLDENFLMSIASIGAFIVGDFPEAVAVMLFYNVGEWFEDMAVSRSRKQIMDAVDMRPEVVNLIVENEVRTIPAGDAQIGDTVLVRPGDRIPLDGIILEGESRIDTSPVTGEPVPVSAGIGSAVISGCVNTSGQLKMKVTNTLETSMVTKILDSVENAAANKPKMDRFITRFSRIYTPVVVAAAVLLAIIPSLITGDWSYWIYTALTFLVISCPCALVLSVPLAFFSGIGAGSKNGILFKGGASLEALNDVKAVVMDKTGTITKGNFAVQDGSDELIAMAASAELGSSHPIGTSIVAAARERGLVIKKPDRMEEIAGKGIRIELDEDEILCGNRKLMEDHAVDLSSLPEDTYGTEVFLAKNNRYLGRILISDTLKEHAAEAVSRMKKRGLKTIMLTGDDKRNADHIASEAGIDIALSRLLPEEKLNYMEKFRNEIGNTMFVGDGINDAPVLAGANVGAAMGTGADAAIEAADVVFMTSSMDAIPQSLAIAAKSSLIAKENVAFALIVKIGIMVLGLLGFASMWMAVIADTGVAMLCILNSVRVLYTKYH